MTSKPCTEIYNDTKSDKFLIISKLNISKSDLEKIIRDSIQKARSIKKQKSLEKNNSQVLSYLQDVMPIINFSDALDYNDMMGLIGEIVSELHHEQCLRHDPVYVKWRDTGTSKSCGLDLVFHKNNQLISIECKHPHESLRNHTNNALAILFITINRGFVRHDDYRTTEFIAKLHTRYSKTKRLLDGAHSDTTELTNKMNLLRELIKKNDLIEEVELVADQIHHTFDISKDLSDKINFDKISKTSKQSGVNLLLLENIQEMSEDVFNEQ